MDEKSYELEQRNLLLVRAKQAIEALKMELERQRIESKRHTEDLDGELRRSKLENDEMSYKHHEKALNFESQISKADHIINNKEILRIAAEDKIVKLKDFIADKARIEAELGLKISEGKTDHDIYMKNIQYQHEKDTERMSADYKDDIVQLKSNHSKDLLEVDSRHKINMEYIRTEMETVTKDVKKAINEDLYKTREELSRVKEEFSTIMHDKTEEIRSLHLSLDNNRSLLQVTQKDLLTSNSDHQTSNNSYELKLDKQQQEEENKIDKLKTENLNLIISLDTAKQNLHTQQKIMMNADKDLKKMTIEVYNISVQLFLLSFAILCTFMYKYAYCMWRTIYICI
jgi:hypothetical protein